MIALRQHTAAAPSAQDATEAHPLIPELAFYLLGALVVLLAALTHFWRLDLAEFKQDELDVATLALALAQHGQWPAHGILSSIGTYNGPLFVALEAVPALLWPTPLAMTAFVAALNVVTVGGTIIFARRYFGATAALVAGLTFATAPWAVLYGRKIWEQDALPPFVLLFFVGLFLVVVDRRPWWLPLCGAAASVAVQLHPSAVVLPLIALVALVLRRRRFAPAPVAAALGVGLLLLLPYLAQEWRYRFADWSVALHQPATAHLGPALALVVAVLNWAQAASAWQVLGLFTAVGLSRTDPWYVTAADLLAWLGMLAGAVLLIGQTRQALRRQAEGEFGRRDDALLLLALWLLLPPLALGATGMLTYSHYFIVSYPAPFLVFGVLASRASRARVGTHFAAALVVPLIVCNVLTLAHVAALAERAPAPSQYGLPLAYAEQAAAAMVRDANGAPVALTVDPGYRDGDVVIARLVRWDSGAAGASLNNAPPREYWVQPASAPPPPGAHLLRALGTGRQATVTVWAANADMAGGMP